MLATSRSASRRALLKSVVALSPDGVLRGLVISEETGGVHDESGRSIAKNGRAAEKSLAGVHAIELLDDDFLLADELVDDERCAPLGQLDEHDLTAGGAGGRRQADALTQPDGGEEIVADGDDLPSLRLEQHRLREAECLEYVRERDRVNLLVDSCQDGARQRQTHSDAGAEPRVGVHLQRAAERAHPGGHDVESDTASRDLGHLLRRREAGPGDDRDELLT